MNPGEKIAGEQLSGDCRNSAFVVTSRFGENRANRVGGRGDPVSGRGGPGGNRVYPLAAHSDRGFGDRGEAHAGPHAAPGGRFEFLWYLDESHDVAVVPTMSSRKS